MPSQNPPAQPSASSHLTTQPNRTEDPPQVDECPYPPGRQGKTADVHFENISASPDAQQVLVSTVQKSLYGKSIVVEARGNQILGQMGDPSIQRLSQDRAAVLLAAQQESKQTEDTKSLVLASGPGRRLGVSGSS